MPGEPMPSATDRRTSDAGGVTFRPQLGAQIASLIPGVLLTGFVAFPLSRFILARLPRVDPGVPSALFIGIWAIGLLFVTFWVFWVQNRSVRVTDSRVQVRRPGRTVHDWQRSTTRFTPHIVRRTMNGLPNGSDRSILVDTTDGRTELKLTAFSRRSYSALVAAIGAIDTSSTAAGSMDDQNTQNTHTADTAETPNTDGTSPTMTPPTYQMVGSGRSDGQGHPTRDHAAFARTPFSSATFTTTARRVRSRAWASVALVGAAWLALSAVFAYVPGLREDITAILAYGGVSAAAIGLAIALGIPAASAGRGVPDVITVTGTSITLDRDTVGFHDLASILVTPPGSLTARTVTTVDHRGRRRTIDFGWAGARAWAKRDAFPDYPAFVDAILAATARRPGLTSFDLH
ncbi:hypothetical protein [Plantibacter sp. YIM 135347]|uniref:hypothetical protein n=1 Tax=Plantibacter sp. YIM 135347 TaxID=3423919 RepID=UPI003D3559C3